ncbi:hypothetical protein CC85DRAFT_118976 [Cutaneotrichosporon oleaginosum]|uniref:Uncharacterized protein n=1 Tax=Cutaneotrichosporon oleaginosum TaxID=879819 RepID=A0A0J0XKE3_9TREE|nr:uncharacterized protein CC85DRAFT_118976 [Cutaneotrichosporon oleaginosum]KLT41588.1 hypothetical protein CC85DRAFT_118976 [Cutaneotrichosporon oleaginosum]TXT09354.1 hypothetical protein COLE_03288 [Cutaneotrichosporon oleaginosum]
MVLSPMAPLYSRRSQHFELHNNAVQHKRRASVDGYTQRVGLVFSTSSPSIKLRLAFISRRMCPIPTDIVRRIRTRGHPPRRSSSRRNDAGIDHLIIRNRNAATQIMQRGIHPPPRGGTAHGRAARRLTQSRTRSATPSARSALVYSSTPHLVPLVYFRLWTRAPSGDFRV